MSSEYFSWPFKEAIARNLLKGVKSDEALRIKLVMTRDGELSIKTSPLPAFGDLIRLKLAKRPIDSNNIFLFHKTTNRRVYEEAKKDVKKCDDVILYNEREELTETTIANLYVEVDGSLLTPPLDCGLLPGAFRASMLSKRAAFERVLYKEDLLASNNIFIGNSLRGLQKALLYF